MGKVYKGKINFTGKSRAKAQKMNKRLQEQEQEDKNNPKHDNLHAKWN